MKYTDNVLLFLNYELEKQTSEVYIKIKNIFKQDY